MEMENRTLFNDNWGFLKTELGTELSDIRGRIGEFRPVDLPHDWLIYDTHNLYENSTGWYRKCIVVVDLDNAEVAEVRRQEGGADAFSLISGQRMILRFDGVYMDSTLYVNGQKVGTGNMVILPLTTISQNICGRGKMNC